MRGGQDGQHETVDDSDGHAHMVPDGHIARWSLQKVVDTNSLIVVGYANDVVRCSGHFANREDHGLHGSVRVLLAVQSVVLGRVDGVVEGCVRRISVHVLLTNVILVDGEIVDTQVRIFRRT